MHRPSTPKLSIVVPCYNEEGNLGPLLAAVKENMPLVTWEIVLVDDGSSDGTLEQIRELSAHDSRIRYLSFSRNFGHQVALRAGLDAATGDCVVSMDADLQHPPRMIPELLAKWREGYDVVLTVREDADGTSAFKKASSNVFYRVMRRVFGVSIRSGAADFRLLDRTVVEALKLYRDPSPFYRGFIGQIGFSQIAVPYKAAPRHSGETKYTLRKMMSFARAGIIGTSVVPLRLAFIMTIFFAAFFVLFAAYILAMSIWGEGVEPGWASTTMLIAVVGLGQSLCMAILSEYVAQISISTRGRPPYILKETSPSLPSQRVPAHA